MSENLLGSVVVPIADEDDAAATARAIAPYVDAGDRLAVVHVVEKAGGAIDKASVEQRESHAEDIFEAFQAAIEKAIEGVAIVDESAPDDAGTADSDVTLEAELRYGTDVAAEILDCAADCDATAIAYTSRGLSRWVEFLTGNVDDALLEAADRPVVVLPNPGT